MVADSVTLSMKNKMSRFTPVSHFTPGYPKLTLRTLTRYTYYREMN